MKQRPLVVLILAALFLFSDAAPALGQDKKLDSLKRMLAKTPEDTSKVNLLLAISKQLLSDAPVESIAFAERARELAETESFATGLALSYKQIGMGYYFQSKWVDAINNWELARNAFEAAGDKKGVANILSNLGAIYFNQGDDEKALGLYIQALKAAEEIKDTLRIATVDINIGAIYGKKPKTYQKGLNYDMEALALAKKLGNTEAIGTVTANIGEIYFRMHNYQLALEYLFESLEATKGTPYEPTTLNHICQVYNGKGNYEKAIEYSTRAIVIAKKLDSKLDQAQALARRGEALHKKGSLLDAIQAYQEAEAIALPIKDFEELKDIYSGISESYLALQDYKNASTSQQKLVAVKDSIYNIETDKKLGTIQFQYSIDKLTKDKALQELDLQKQKLVTNAFMGGMLFIVIITVILFRNYKAKVKINQVLDKQKDQIEHLLLNILPQEVATELQEVGESKPRYYESVSVLFTDFKSFTSIAEGMEPAELVEELNTFFKAFDEIIEANNLEKIKTIGDSYMCAGGIPTANDTHPLDIMKAAVDICHYMDEHNKRREELGLIPWHLRVGIHTGPLVAGVVGRKKYAYDIWGRTVNIASRMESNGEPGKINVSDAMYMLIKDHYKCWYRGKIHAKNLGDIDMYFVDVPSDQEVTPLEESLSASMQ
jgi:adenylate cyclase